MKVQTTVLRQAFDVLMHFLEEDKGASFDLSHDYYWQLSGIERLSLAENPTASMTGQASDDLDGIERLAKGEVVAEYVGLARVANVLRMIADEGVHDVPRGGPWGADRNDGDEGRARPPKG